MRLEHKKNKMKKLLLFLIVATWQLSLTAQRDIPINVASFNLRLNTTSDGENAWPHRSEFVMDLIRYHEFDIIGTQEAFFGQIEDLLTMEAFAYTGSGRDDGLQGGEHAAIFYKKERFELLQSGDFWLSETPDAPSLGWDATCCHRVCSWAQFLDKENGLSFYVFNAHFDHEGVVARKESGKLMVKKIREIAGDQPVIFCGDLNSTPDTEQIKHISNFLHDAYVVSESPPYGPVGTFSGFNLNAPLKNRIDYVFVSDDFQVAKYGALTDFQNNRFPSDHLPVAVKLQFDSQSSMKRAYKKKVFHSETGDSLLYRVLYPDNYDPAAKYPLVLFMHGAGERGSDNEKQLTHGATLFTDPENRLNYPAIVVFPQCPENKYWVEIAVRTTLRDELSDTFKNMKETPVKEQQMVIDLVHALLASEAVDPDRLYIMGLSMGAMGTFDILARHPQLFAAAIPICGGGNTNAAANYAPYTSLWITHGAKDDVVPVNFSQEMYEALKSAGADVKYTEFPNANHNAWDPTFELPGLLDWLFSKSR